MSTNTHDDHNTIGAAKVTTPRIQQLIGGPPVLFWGAPGVGKTQGLTKGVNGFFSHELDRLDIATGKDEEGKAERKKELKKRLEILIASVREPTDFSGLPIPNEYGSYTLAAPAWATRLKEIGEAHLHDMPVAAVLYFDEISTASPAVQAALLRVVLDREVGDITLPDNIWICAAANPPSMAAGGWDMAPPLANRFMHMWWGIDSGEWAKNILNRWGKGWAHDYENENDPKPRLRRGLASVVSAYITRNGDSLFSLPPKNKQKETLAWPSPRSWEAAIYLMSQLSGFKADHHTKELTAEDIKGPWQMLIAAIGKVEAVSFNSFRKYADVMPDPKWIFAKSNAPTDKALAAIEKRTDLTEMEVMERSAGTRGPQILRPLAKKHTQDVAFAVAQMLVTVYTDKGRGFMNKPDAEGGGFDMENWERIWEALLTLGEDHPGLIGGPVLNLIQQVPKKLPGSVNERIVDVWGDIIYGD